MTQIVEPEIETAAHVHRWTRAEYYHMAETGLFGSLRTELIEGQVIDLAPMGSRHATALANITQVLVRTFPNHHIRIQMPLSMSDHSEPEPDAAVVEGRSADFTDAHPTAAALVIEVSDTTLGYDRREKASLYAKSGIAEYWIVNLKAGVLEALRGPIEDAEQPFGYGYASSVRLQPGESIAPLFAPASAISVASLLP